MTRRLWTFSGLVPTPEGARALVTRTPLVAVPARVLLVGGRKAAALGPVLGALALEAGSELVVDTATPWLEAMRVHAPNVVIVEAPPPPPPDLAHQAHLAGTRALWADGRDVVTAADMAAWAARLWRVVRRPAQTPRPV